VGFGAAGFAAGAPAPGLARAAAKMSAMLMPLPPGATFFAGPEALASAAGASAGADPVTAAAAGSSTGLLAAGAGDEAPPLAFSARAAARISSTDSFFAMFRMLVSRHRESETVSHQRDTATWASPTQPCDISHELQNLYPINDLCQLPIRLTPLGSSAQN